MDQKDHNIHNSKKLGESKQKQISPNKTYFQLKQSLAGFFLGKIDVRKLQNVECKKTDISEAKIVSQFHPHKKRTCCWAWRITWSLVTSTPFGVRCCFIHVISFTQWKHWNRIPYKQSRVSSSQKGHCEEQKHGFFSFFCQCWCISGRFLTLIHTLLQNHIIDLWSLTNVVLTLEQLHAHHTHTSISAFWKNSNLLRKAPPPTQGWLRLFIASTLPWPRKPSEDPWAHLEDHRCSWTTWKQKDF